MVVRCCWRCCCGCRWFRFCFVWHECKLRTLFIWYKRHFNWLRERITNDYSWRRFDGRGGNEWVNNWVRDKEKKKKNKKFEKTCVRTLFHSIRQQQTIYWIFFSSLRQSLALCVLRIDHGSSNFQLRCEVHFWRMHRLISIRATTAIRNLRRVDRWARSMTEDDEIRWSRWSRESHLVFDSSLQNPPFSRISETEEKLANILQR